MSGQPNVNGIAFPVLFPILPLWAAVEILKLACHVAFLLNIVLPFESILSFFFLINKMEKPEKGCQFSLY